MVSQPRKPLLTKKKELSPEALQVFTHWFEMFSADEYMLPIHCVNFIKFTTGAPDQVILENDSRVGEFFKAYDSDIDGRITLEDFLGFYRQKSFEKPDIVWNNLLTAKYGNDLKPISEYNNPDDRRVISDPMS